MGILKSIARLNHYFLKRKIRKWVSRCLRDLAEIQFYYFNYYFPTTRLDQTTHEKKIFRITKRFFLTLNDARNSIKNDTTVLSSIERLYEIVCSSHLIRLRVSEKVLFDICSNELRYLQKNSCSLWLKLAARSFSKKMDIDTSVFFESIQAFETIYERTLQIIVREPNVFLFFIQDLYALQDVTKQLIAFLQEIY